MFTGRVAIVTGGARGIGAAITRSLAAGGAHVAAGYQASGYITGAIYNLNGGLQYVGIGCRYSKFDHRRARQGRHANLMRR